MERFSLGRGAENTRLGGEFRDRGGGRGRGSNISLREVIYYTLILSFATMATYWVDRLARKASRARHMSESR